MLPGQGGCNLFPNRIPFKIKAVFAVNRAEFFSGGFAISGVVMFYFGAVCTFVLLFFAPTDAVDFSYVAAVYEHNLIMNPNPRAPLSRLEALQHLQKNLDIFEDQAARAAQQVLTGHDRSTKIFGWTLSRGASSCSTAASFYICLLADYPPAKKGSAIFSTIV